jgi:hypothetical protein
MAAYEAREREQKESAGWGSEREYIWGKGQETISPVLKFPRQFPFVLLVELMYIIGINFLPCLNGCIIVKFDQTFGGLHVQHAV